MHFDLERDAAVLARTPGIVRALLADLDPAWTHARYGEGTWSPHEIVGHLVFGEQTDWIPRAHRILDHAEAAPFDPFDRAGHLPMCRAKSLSELLDLFASLRAENIAALRAMPLRPADLARRGRHPAFGAVTLEQLLCTWVVHDLHHIGHICKAMAHQHRTEVGPWSAYLSILDPPQPR